MLYTCYPQNKQTKKLHLIYQITQSPHPDVAPSSLLHDHISACNKPEGKERGASM